MRRRRLVGFSIVLLLGLFVHAGCGSESPELFTVQHDAGAEADAAGDAEPDFDPTLGGPCTDDAQCDDAIPCTYDRCDQTLLRCRNTPDDSLCADDIYCNGKERCVLRVGCAPGPVVTCQDGSPCTIDRCVEETKSCEHVPRDVDGDGDVDDHCVAHKDCDDHDPSVSSTATEICGNLKDDDCDGLLDEPDCVAPANDVCATALAIDAPGTFLLSSVATKKDYATSCSVATPAAGRDVVVKITVPPGGDAKNVLVAASTHTPANEVAIALQATCGSAPSEIACGHVESAPEARAIARGVAAGDSIYAIVTTQKESALDLRVDMLPASGPPTNEDCAAPTPVALETPFVAQIVDAAKDLVSGCEAKTGELTYSFTLAAPRDVRIFATPLGTTTGRPVISIRDPACTGELRCRVGSAPPAFARNMPAGTHVFTVAGTTQLDASVRVRTFDPTPAPPTQSCDTAPDVTPNTAIPVDLSNHEDAIANGCLPGGPAAAYKLDLAVASDVLVVGRFSLNEQGAVAIHGPVTGPGACTTADVLACQKGQTPVRASRRNLAPGSYRIVVADELGQSANLMVLVRPTVPPTVVAGSDACVNPITIPAAGGFFTGDTSTAAADFNASCDAPGGPLGGARDRLLRLDLAQPQRVVFDMSGSFFTTLLDIRKGPQCPGLELPGMCHVGFGPSRSFLDVQLTPGTHWIQIDGFGADSGPFDLDVRVLPP